MSLTLTELIDSRESALELGPNGSVRVSRLTLHYVLKGTGDDATARSVVENSTPESYDGLVRQNIEVEPQYVDTVTGRGTWSAEVSYGLPERQEPQTGESSFSFETTGGTQHLQIGYWRETYKGAGQPPITFGGINDDGEQVHGVDITAPTYKFRETHYLSDSTVTQDYIGRLFRLTGKVNAKSFRGLEPGECLFLGARGSQRGEEDWEITFEFAGRPNNDDIRGDLKPWFESHGFNQPIPVKGWEYVWIRYVKKENNGRAVLAPAYVVVEQVYQYGDFSELGIGT